ncbi:MAG: hypothetical protein FWD66_10950 [Paludibacter sp.]|nr:hypothetical protein [Paludibacter sp.]
MKKTVWLLFILGLLTAGCTKEATWDDSDFQLFGDSAEIPSLYFWNGKGDPITSGTAKGSYSIELTTTADISGIFHLGYFEVGRFYKKDIIKKEFKLKKGETFTDSGNFSFYGTVYDSAEILVDISTNASSNPATIKNSNVTIK